jgi:FkbM family methyltransferase
MTYGWRVDIEEIPLGPARVRVAAPGDERLAAFWSGFADGHFEPGTRRVVEQHAAAGATIVDVGAWIGPFTLLAAALGANVVAYEPDPSAVAALRANLARNPELAERVVVHEVALGRSTSRQTLVAPEVGLGNGRSRLAGRGSGTEPAIDGSAVEVQAIAVHGESTTDAWRTCGLLKLDIEGGEYGVVPRLRRYLRETRPALLLSLHGPDPASALAKRFGHLRLAGLRVAGCRRRMPLLWTVRCYRHRLRVTDHRTDEWRPLSFGALLLLAVRVGETELYLHG